MARVYIKTYGCTLNQADTDIMRAILESGGHEICESEAESEITILNTCTVKGATEDKIFERIRKSGAGNFESGIGNPGHKTQNPKLVIAGCLVANAPKLRKYLPNAPLVSPSSIMHICAAVEDALEGRATLYTGNESKERLPRILGAPICRIPINEGCVSSCNFCQTRLARPRLRSYSPKAVVGWINRAVSGGAREIQLTSQDSGAYGMDIRTDLLRLLDAISNDDSGGRAGGEFLVRLGMINPNHAKRMLDGIIGAMQGPRFYRFLHVPVQAGSEKVCDEMNRDHTVKDFEDIVREVRSKVADAMISTDIIVGYPTETDDDFQKTLELLQKTRPEIANLSKFSPRPFTKARELGQLTNTLVKRRSEEAAKLIKGITLAQRQRYIGRTMRVLVTEKGKDFKGRALNYHQVVVKKFRGKLGDFIDVDINDANLGSLFGEPSG